MRPADNPTRAQRLAIKAADMLLSAAGLTTYTMLAQLVLKYAIRQKVSQ